MIHSVKLLCPSKKCRKCIRFGQKITEKFRQLNEEVEIEIVDQLEGWKLYNTWILPTVTINGKVISRGYVPSLKQIKSVLYLPDD
jgi:hypothetical protein